MQVADSVCGYLNCFVQHDFVVVLSRCLKSTGARISEFPNVKVIFYDMPKNVAGVLTGRNGFLDDLVVGEKVDAVLTIFGPSLWIPKVLHVSGFARAQCLLHDSPFYTTMNKKELFLAYIRQKVWMWAFCRCADVYFTENEYISTLLSRAIGGKYVYTITNYYNQIYDETSRWTRTIRLPFFDGVTLLTITANYPHKNLRILPPTISYLHNKYPGFKFRFVLTVTEAEFAEAGGDIVDDIVFLGKVSLTECPNLYEQCDIVFSSTLMECFSAVYPEAMRMKKPIITTDLPVIRTLCGEAALYYDALSPESFGDAIYRLSMNTKLQDDLVERGGSQLGRYDTSEMRAKKLIGIVEKEYAAGCLGK